MERSMIQRLTDTSKHIQPLN